MNQISIIIPTYNCDSYIVEAVESALTQGKAVLEVIVVDDGSCDNTEGVLKDLLAKIQYVKQENQGVSAARNHGAALAKAEWLLFLDSDDRLAESAVEKIWEQIDGQEGVLFGNVLEERNGEVKVRKTHFQEGPPPEGALGSFWKCFIPTPGAALVHKNVHLAINGFKNYQPVEDRMYWMQAGMVCAFTYVDVNMVHKRDVPDSASSDRAKGLVSGLHVQIDFIAWCREKGFNLERFEVDPVFLIEHSLKKARRYHCWQGIRWLLKEAQRYSVSSPTIIYYKRMYYLFAIFDVSVTVMWGFSAKAKKYFWKNNA